MSGEQDIRKMGGLKKQMPTTYLTFLIGSLAISGIFPFAGFFSKDEILSHAFENNKLLWLVGAVASAMTAFYMFRLLFLTFWGEFRGTHEQEHHLHESPKTITLPLIVLAILSVVGGFVGLPEVFHAPHLLEKFLAPVFEDSYAKLLPLGLAAGTEMSLMIFATLVAVAMIAFAYQLYITKAQRPEANEANLPGYQRVISKTYYVNELYDYTITKPLNWIARNLNAVFENRVVDAIVNGLGDLVVNASKFVRLIQTGSIELYMLIMVIGIALMLFIK